MSLKFFNGRKYTGSFLEFQEKLFSLNSNENFVNILYEKLQSILKMNEKDLILPNNFIKYDNFSNCKINTIHQSFIKYIFYGVDDLRFNFSKYNENILSRQDKFYENIYNRLNVNIIFQCIDNVIYCEIDSHYDDIIKFIDDYVGLTNYSYWDNVDKDPHINLTEWEKRSKIWHKWMENDDVSFKFRVFNFMEHHHFFNLIKKIIYK